MSHEMGMKMAVLNSGKDQSLGLQSDENLVNNGNLLELYHLM